MTQAPSVNSPDLLFIDGCWVKPSTGRKLQVVNPTDESVYIEVAEAMEADVHRAIAAARDAFDRGPWPRLSHMERAQFLSAISTAIAERTEDIADAWTREMGILRNASGAVAAGIPAIYGSYAAMAQTFPFVESRTPKAGATAYLVREPVGVVGAIVPWNSPATMIAHKIAPALLSGCTVVVKTSPEAPSAGLIVAEVCEAVGLPPGVVNVLTADREASSALVSHPDVDKITFTGSSATGKAIASICGSRVARCTLELGGKSAGIVLDDYDLDAAARSIAATARIMTGQVCSSLTRIIVSRHRHDALVEAMAAEFASTVVGDPFDPLTQMGPIASARQRDRVESYIDLGKRQGAVLATGGRRPGHLEKGYFVEPTLFAEVSNDMIVAREEIFGPVVCVLPADDERHAVAIANDTVFGLNASVFTHDADRAYAIARELRSGTVGHNSWRTDFSIAFGGFKQSGLGREGSIDGLNAFLETKTIILDAEPTTNPAGAVPAH